MNQDDEEDYLEAHKEFYEIYNPLREKYRLGMNSHFSAYPKDDDWIEIWRYEGGQKKEMVCRADGENAADCYRRAVHHLKFWTAMKAEHHAAQIQGRAV